MATGLQNAHSNVLSEALKQGLQSFVSQFDKLTATTTAGTPAAGNFYSSILNRAAIADLSKDLGVRFGIERMVAQQVYQLEKEVSSTGEPVFGMQNDDRGLVRFVGNGWISPVDSLGPRIENPTATTNGTFVEVTFYGTGLNLLWGSGVGGGDLRASVDGGAEGSNLISATIATSLNSRNVAPYIIVPVVSGLALGVHTVKIRANTTGFSFEVNGFEIINTSMIANPGTAYIDFAKTRLLAQQTLSYNSGFDSGSLGTRGGRVLMYLKQDGTIGKAVTPVNLASAFLTNADHTNEEIARSYDFREFGAGLSGDFSGNLTTVTSSFMLDDGTTVLAGTSLGTSTNGSSPTLEYLTAGATSAFIQFSFVGTGLDIYLVGTSLTPEVMNVMVDGVAVGNISCTANKHTTVKLASGLPYGTHTVRITRSATVGFFGMRKFIVYQPKKPTLPADTMELTEYNVVADYVADTTSPNNFESNISTGVILKGTSREMMYSGSWTVPANLNSISGFLATGTANNDFVQYTFFGTGIETRLWLGGSGSTATTYNMTFLVDGQALNAGTNVGSTVAVHGPNLGSIAVSAAGVLTGSSGTSGVGYGSRVRITGLPLGLHTIRVTRNSITGGDPQFYFSGFHVITPTHATKQIAGASQASGTVGSMNLADLRKFTTLKDVGAQKKNVAQAFGLTPNPSTTSTAFVPVPDMSVIHTNTTGRVRISYTLSLNTNTSPGDSRVYVDGVPVGERARVYQGTVAPLTSSFVLDVAPGTHKYDVFWMSNSGSTINRISTYSVLTVEEAE